MGWNAGTGPHTRIHTDTHTHTRLTSKVRPFCQGGDGGPVFREDIHRPILYKVHVVADRAMPDNVVPWEVDLTVEFGDDGGDERV